jgi:hypothetical protein
MKTSIWELIDPNLNSFVFVISYLLFPLKLTWSKITQSDACLEILTAFGTRCIVSVLKWWGLTLSLGKH